MIKWLRRRVARLERRWISDEADRQRHDEHVRGRLNQTAAPNGAESDSDEHVADRRDSHAG